MLMAPKKPSKADLKPVAFSSAAESKQVAVLKKIAAAIATHAVWKNMFFTNVATKRVHFYDQVTADNLGHFINLMSKVASGEAATAVLETIAAMSLAHPFNRANTKKAIPIQDNEVDIKKVQEQVSGYLVSDNTVTATFTPAVRLLGYLCTHDISHNGQDAVCDQHIKFNENIQPVLQAVWVHLHRFENLTNTDAEAIRQELVNQTIDAADHKKPKTDFGRRLKEIKEAGDFPTFVAASGKTPAEALAGIGKNKDLCPERLEYLADLLMNMGDGKKPPQPISQEISTVDHQRRGQDNGSLTRDGKNRLVDHRLNVIVAVSGQEQRHVRSDGQNLIIGDSNNRNAADTWAIMNGYTHEPDGKRLYVNDAVLNTVGRATYLLSVWDASQEEDIRKLRQNLWMTRPHNPHPIDQIPPQIQEITGVKLLTMPEQFKELESGKESIHEGRALEIHKKVVDGSKLTDDEYNLHLRDVLMSGVKDRAAQSLALLGAKNPANIYDLMQFLLLVLNMQMTLFAMGMPVALNIWHVHVTPTVDLAEFKDAHGERLKGIWVLMHLVLRRGVKLINAYTKMDKFEKMLSCGLTLKRLTRMFEATTFIVYSLPDERITGEFVEHTIKYLSNIPTKFIWSKLEPMFTDQQEQLKTNVSHVLNSLVVEDDTLVGTVIGPSTWLWLAEHLTPLIDQFIENPEAYKAEAKAFKAPKPKAKKTHKLKKGTMSLKNKIQKQRKAPRKGIISKGKASAGGKETGKNKHRKKTKTKDKKNKEDPKPSESTNTTTADAVGSHADFFGSSSSAPVAAPPVPYSPVSGM